MKSDLSFLFYPEAWDKQRAIGALLIPHVISTYTRIHVVKRLASTTTPQKPSVSLCYMMR